MKKFKSSLLALSITLTGALSLDNSPVHAVEDPDITTYYHENRPGKLYVNSTLPPGSSVMVVAAWGIPSFVLCSLAPNDGISPHELRNHKLAERCLSSTCPESEMQMEGFPAYYVTCTLYRSDGAVQHSFTRLFLSPSEIEPSVQLEKDGTLTVWESLVSEKVRCENAKLAGKDPHEELAKFPFELPVYGNTGALGYEFMPGRTAQERNCWRCNVSDRMPEGSNSKYPFTLPDDLTLRRFTEDNPETPGVIKSLTGSLLTLPGSWSVNGRIKEACPHVTFDPAAVRLTLHVAQRPYETLLRRAAEHGSPVHLAPYTLLHFGAPIEPIEVRKGPAGGMEFDYDLGALGCGDIEAMSSSLLYFGERSPNPGEPTNQSWNVHDLLITG
ncbi:MAG: hypothetical protein LBJ95_01530 [Oscillospiraceae bacterium]|nr:hypothetical protein [Oscillospiraceae bacterium]